MMTSDKPKHKNIPGVVRRFQAGLLIWIILTLLAAFYPLLWLVPPYIHLTPFVYIGVSLLWIPFTVRHIRRFGMRRLTMLLMVGCVFVTGIMAKDFREINPGLSHCGWFENSYVCTEGCDYINYRYEFKSPGAFPVIVLVDRYEWSNYLLSCIFF